jgi:hypothetical protein
MILGGNYERGEDAFENPFAFVAAGQQLVG